MYDVFTFITDPYAVHLFMANMRRALRSLSSEPLVEDMEDMEDWGWVEDWEWVS